MILLFIYCTAGDALILRQARLPLLELFMSRSCSCTGTHLLLGFFTDGRTQHQRSSLDLCVYVSAPILQLFAALLMVESCLAFFFPAPSSHLRRTAWRPFVVIKGYGVFVYLRALITVTEQNVTAGLQTVASGTRLHSRPTTWCQDLHACSAQGKGGKE